MKIQIDTSTKTIKVQENTNFKKLYEMLKALPKEVFGKWDEYSIEANTQIIWGYYPWYNWYGSGTITIQDSTGVIGTTNNNTFAVTNVSNTVSSTPTVFNFELN